MVSSASDVRSGPRHSGWRLPRLPSTAQASLTAAIVFALFGALQLSGWADRAAGSAVTALVFPAFGLLYVSLAALAARRARGRLRTAWGLMAIGFACWAVGDVIYAWYALTAGPVPDPSWADVAYLSYVPLVAAALVLFPPTRTWREQQRMILDSVIVTGSFFIIAWLAAIRTVWLGTGNTPLQTAVALAYPCGDVLILTLGFLVMIRAPVGRRRTIVILVAGLACAAVADLISVGPGVPGRIPEMLWAANALLVIVALVSAVHTGRGIDSTVASAPSLLSLWSPLLLPAVTAIFLAGSPRAAATEPAVIVAGSIVVVATLARQLIETAELIRREQQIRRLADQLNGELSSAAKYVGSILPGDLTGPVRVTSRYLPSQAVGGDSYGYRWIDDDHLIVYLIDVSGHGVESALLSVSIHNLLRSGSLPTATLLSPDRVLAELNQRFAMDSHGDHYFTMWIGVYQRSTGALRYANAGHPPPLVLQPDADNAPTIGVLAGGGMPVGMFAGAGFGVSERMIAPGTTILVYSDGVLGDPPRTDRLAAVCAESAAGGVLSVDAIVAGLDSAGESVQDDRSLVLLSFVS